MEMISSISFAIHVQLGKLRTDQGRVYDEHQFGRTGADPVKTVTRVAVFECEGEQFLIPIYNDRSCVNPLLNRGKDLLVLSKRTIGSAVYGNEAGCLDKYNAGEHNIGRFISEIIDVRTADENSVKD